MSGINKTNEGCIRVIYSWWVLCCWYITRYRFSYAHISIRYDDGIWIYLNSWMNLSVNYACEIIYIRLWGWLFFNYLRSILTTFHRKKCKILEILCNFVYRMMFHVGLMILSLFVFAWLWEIEDLRMIFRIQSCMWYL